MSAAICPGISRFSRVVPDEAFLPMLSNWGLRVRSVVFDMSFCVENYGFFVRVEGEVCGGREYVKMRKYECVYTYC